MPRRFVTEQGGYADALTPGDQALPGPPNGPAGGDLGFTYPNPTVVALHTGGTRVPVGPIRQGALLGRQTGTDQIADGLIIGAVVVPIAGGIVPLDNTTVTVNVAATFPGLIALGVPVYVLNSDVFNYGAAGAPVCMAVISSGLDTIDFFVVNMGGLATGASNLNVFVAVDQVAS